MSDGDLFDDLPGTAAEAPAGTVPENAAETSVATETPVEPPPPPVVPETPLPHRRRNAELPAAGSLGEKLAALRNGCGMTIEDVADETRIKACYIESLEKDDFSDLPHMVYALAYVKKLCGVYGVAGTDADELMNGLREQLAYEIPEDIDKSVICREQDAETRRKLRQISIALIAGAVAVVLLLISGVTVLVLRSHHRQELPQTAGEPQLAEDWMEWHRPQQQLRSTRIELTPKSRGKTRR